MVLTDREIQVAIEQGQLVVDPKPGGGQYSSTSLDLTLAPRIRIWQVSCLAGEEPLTLSPGDKGYSHDALAEKHTELVELGQNGHVIAPGSFLLGWTREYIELPAHSRLAARVEGKAL